MTRAALFALAVAVAAPALAGPRAKARAKAKASVKGRKKAPSGPPPPPPQIELRTIDLAAGLVHVEVTGPARPPDAQQFVLTDERKRRIVPPLAECKAPAPDGPAGPPAGPSAGKWRCSLTIPRIYQRAALTMVSFESHGQMASVQGERVQKAWAEARALTPLPTMAERPREPGQPWGTRVRVPDGGPTVDKDEVDSETEE